LDTKCKREERLLASEADLSEDGAQVHPSLSGWPWENISFWESPLFDLVKHKKLYSLSPSLIIALRIGNSTHKT
jgi:hypothetical protein